MTGPQTLAQWLRGLRRRGVQCRLDDSGRLRSRGLKMLAAAEREALSASAPMVLDLLLERRARRKKRAEEQQHCMSKPQERPRRVVGMHVVPGYPQLSRPLYADECKEIDVLRARARQGSLRLVGWR